LLHIDRLALLRKAGIAGDDEEPGDARERGDDFVDHAVGEILFSGWPLILAKGKTAIDGLSGNARRGASISGSGVVASDRRRNIRSISRIRRSTCARNPGLDRRP
jgi:hypothetical protein